MYLPTVYRTFLYVLLFGFFISVFCEYFVYILTLTILYVSCHYVDKKFREILPVDKKAVLITGCDTGKSNQLKCNTVVHVRIQLIHSIFVGTDVCDVKDVYPLIKICSKLMLLKKLLQCFKMYTFNIYVVCTYVFHFCRTTSCEVHSLYIYKRSDLHGQLTSSHTVQ